MTISNDIKLNKVIGGIGGCNAAYYGLADTYYQKEITRIPNNFTRTVLNVAPNPLWEQIVTFDCMGIDAATPTIAATTCHMNIPEIGEAPIPATKIAIEQVWSLRGVADRLGVDEATMRINLSRRTGNIDVLNYEYDTFFPQIGGTTVYIFGDYNKKTKNTKVAARVHDECSGSDTFGTDICTCRPYLLYAIKELDRRAKQGELGILIYNRKEGRSLGEVTKFMVYNARKTHTEGDTKERYFEHTSRVASIEDARLQRLMPDPFLWLGIKRIDTWYSMSNDKSSALENVGIEIVEQIEIPDDYVPQQARVELNAKIDGGYYQPPK
jgi:GTP cyclohydrolase II